MSAALPEGNSRSRASHRRLGLAALLLGVSAGLGCGEHTLDPQEPTVGLTVGAAAAVPLGAYNADIHQTSVSGISSGGYMAVQLHVAFSSIMKGAGIFAGGPYHCAGSSGTSTQAQNSCQHASPLPDVNESITYTGSQAAAGTIDDPSNLAGQKVWLFSGTKDSTVKPVVMNVLQKYYQHYIDAGNIFYKNDLAAGHAHITDNYGSGCATTQSPYINNCSYDGPGLLLAQIYGTLNPRNTGTLSGRLIQFDQSQFLPSPNKKSMDTTGWAYVPAACERSEPCRVHIALHGCQQGQATIGDKYYAHAGYNQWADTNHLIVLYPQAVASFSAPNNPLGCWDFWGYNNATSYATRSGDQLAAIKKMVDRLTSGHPALPAPTGLAASSVSDHGLALAWNSVTGAAGYNIYRGGSSAGPFTKLNASPQSGQSYADTGLTSGTTYYYQVAATDSGGSEGAASAALDVTTTGSPPAIPAPTGLAVTATTGSTIALQWDAAAGVSAYNIYRGTSAGSAGTRANPAPVSGTSFTDSGLAAATTYYYVVKAEDPSGHEGPASAEVSAATGPAAVCFKDNNWNHYRAGRATLCGGNACALGSGQNLGLLSVSTITTLKQTGPSYFVLGTCP
ncbi:MAG TPA: hypothetical protein PLW65_28790 [Pseudomonadota bacterium]|nr:hypothetical protein [Pseudomonadota bacterium]